MMVFPLITSVLTKYSTVRLIQHVSNKISMKIIDDKVNEFIKIATDKLNQMYVSFTKNIFQTFIINIMVIILSLVSLILANTRVLCITAISVLTIITMVNSVIRNSRNIILLKDNWNEIHPRFVSFCKYKKSFSLKITIASMIADEFDFFYSSLNRFQRFGHWLASKTGFVPTKEAIKSKVIRTFSELIIEYVIKVVVFRIVSIFFFYSIFIFLLKPYQLQTSIKMNIFTILVYPFTFSLPLVIHYFTGINKGFAMLAISKLFFLIGIILLVTIPVIVISFVILELIGLKNYTRSSNRNFFFHKFHAPFFLNNLVMKWFLFLIGGLLFIFLSFLIKSKAII